MGNNIRKLGRHKTPEHVLKKCLQMARYLDFSKLPICPDSLDWISGLPITFDFNDYGNSTVGNCTCAAAAHIIQTDTNVVNGTMTSIPVDSVMTAYEAVSGYDPANPDTTDNGANMVDVLNYWKITGIGGHKILGFATFDVTDPTMFQVAMWLFGSLYLGATLPVSASDQSYAGGLWSVTTGNDGGIWGGHAISASAGMPFPSTMSNPDNSSRIAKLVSWGFTQYVSEKFIQKYFDEGHCVLTSDFLINSNAKNIAGFAYNDLISDLNLV